MEVTLSGMVVFLQPNIRVLLFDSIIELQAPLLSYTLFPSDTVMFVKLLQPSNALSLIEMTPSRIVSSFKLLQPLNVLGSTLLLGMEMLTKLVQSLNA